ncbi:MAG: hypothetical protein Q9184_005532, partial [Pyrenodesmia sp. 2 TL-2023]
MHFSKDLIAFVVATQIHNRDLDAFLVASKKQQQLSIDVALHALISEAVETPQILALVAALKATPRRPCY